jgi:multisubunit Na+/H+ antiporter MnhF subunit
VSFILALDILMILLSFSLAICFIRLYWGPNAPNRTAAFDAIALHAASIIVLYAMRYASTALLDAAIVTAALGFLGTTLLARYIEKAIAEGWITEIGLSWREKREKRPPEKQ